MKLVILCGGLGTRLREETEFRPKPLVEIGGRPILWHIMKLYAHWGVRDFVLCLGYRGHMLKEYFLNYEALNNDFTVQLGGKGEIVYHGAHAEQDFRVTLADTGQETMTGGRLKRIARYIDEPHFLVTYGDGLADVNIAQLSAFHAAHGSIATLTAARPRSGFGLIELDPNGRVQQFREKPVLEDWINAGYFVFSRRIFDYLDGDDCVLERTPLERLTAAGELMAYRHDGFFFCMDTYRDHKAANEMWAAGRAPWKVWA